MSAATGSLRPVAPAVDLNIWLTETRTCGVGEAETYAAKLEKKDGPAVLAALTVTLEQRPGRERYSMRRVDTA